jgi:hypothetical protein
MNSKTTELSSPEQPLAAVVFLELVPALVLPVLSEPLSAAVLVAGAEAEAEAAAPEAVERQHMFSDGSVLAAVVVVPLASAGVAAVSVPLSPIAAIPAVAASSCVVMTIPAPATAAVKLW